MAADEWTANSGRNTVIKYCSASATLIGCEKRLRGNVEEFLHHLVANDSLSGTGGSSNKLRGTLRFGRRFDVEGIGKDVRVEEESTAHSFRPGVRGQLTARAGGGT
jgi:hypothetical protein